MSGALAGLVILVIGDSQMMNMLPNLHNQLEDQGAVVHSYAVCGSTAQDWISPGTASCGTLERQDKAPAVSDQKTKPTWNINQLIAEHHPNLVVVQLGDTMAPYGGAHVETAWIHDQVTGLAGRIAANKISCVWIGPTWGADSGPYRRSDAEVQTMSHLLSTSVAPCTYIDSTTFARPGEWHTRDGGHLEPDGYRKWAAAITASIVKLKSQAALNAH
jgi:hypothetical protein